MQQREQTESNEQPSQPADSQTEQTSDQQSGQEAEQGTDQGTDQDQTSADTSNAGSDAADAGGDGGGAAGGGGGGDGGGGGGEMPPADPKEVASDVGQQVSTYLERFTKDLQNFVDNPSLSTAWEAFGPPLLAIGQATVILIVVVIVTSLISKWLSSLVSRVLKKTRIEDTVANFLAVTVKIAIWVLAVPVALAIFGVDATALAALIGAAGLAIGLSLQGSLSNIAAGVVLAVLRPIKLGDYVEINDGDIGVVKDVGMFYSVVTTFNNVRTFVPNAEVLSSRIENFTANSTRRIDVPVGVAYGTDLEFAGDVLQKAATNDIPTRADEQEPRVLLTQFGASSIDFEVQVWCPAREFLAVRHETVLAIDKACKANGITIAFPQRDINFTGPLTLRHEQPGGDRNQNGSTPDNGNGTSDGGGANRSGIDTSGQPAEDNGDGDGGGSSG